MKKSGKPLNDRNEGICKDNDENYCFYYNHVYDESQQNVGNANTDINKENECSNSNNENMNSNINIERDSNVDIASSNYENNQMYSSRSGRRIIPPKKLNL